MRPDETRGAVRGGIRSGVRRLFRLPLRTRARVSADASEELRSFLEARISALTALGMPENEARAEALRRLGHSFTDAAHLLQHSARIRERRMSLREFLDNLAQDARYALRTLGRDRTFTIFALLVVGLGIGASVTVFSIANSVLIRPLPFPDAHQLLWIANQGEGGQSGETVQSNTLLDVIEQTRTLSDVAAYVPFYEIDNTKFTSQTESARLTAVPVTRNFFPVLGVQPMLGRSFSEDESSGTGARAVMLSYLTWKRRFASDPAIVGKPLILDDEPVTVVGVLPPTFDFGSVFAPGTRVDMFVPVPLNEATNRMGNMLYMIGRLRPSVSVAAASAELSVLASRITAAHRDRNTFSASVVTLKQHVSGRVRAALVVLIMSVGVVMLIVCANLSNLLLSRASTREKEVAVRIALGAGRGRLVRQMLTESTVLAAGGATLGLLLAVAGTRLIAGLSSVNLPLLESVSIDGTALAFTVALALIAGVAFGMAPALQLPLGNVHGSLKSSGRGFAGDRKGQWTRNSLVISEVALACVLLVAAGLLARSFFNVLDVDLGFRPQMVASVRVDPDKEQRKSAERFVAYVNELLDRTRSIPGVQSAGLADRLPLGGNRSWGVRAQDKVYSNHDGPDAFVRVISDGYVSAMGMKLVSGRDFSPQDDPASTKVIIINETMARTLWPGENAIGRVVLADYPRLVVGVVGDVRHLSPDAGAGLEIYLPYRQSGDFSAVNVVVRTTLPPQTFTVALRSALQQLVPNLPTKEFQTLQQSVDRAVSPRRFTTVLLGGFAVFAVVLALLGIYGVVSYTVNQRAQEIGVRMALGASATRLQAGIVRSTLMLAAIGIVLGTVASWGLARGMRSFLFGVTSTDPVTFAIMLATLTGVAAVSGYLPARRVSRIDPLSALRSEA